VGRRESCACHWTESVVSDDSNDVVGPCQAKRLVFLFLSRVLSTPGVGAVLIHSAPSLPPDQGIPESASMNRSQGSASRIAFDKPKLMRVRLM